MSKTGVAFYFIVETIHWDHPTDYLKNVPIWNFFHETSLCKAEAQKPGISQRWRKNSKYIAGLFYM